MLGRSRARRGAGAPAPGHAGDGARRFGGDGVSVSRPAVELEAQPVVEAIPQHAGVGSGTKLAVVWALAVLGERDLEAPAVAQAAGSGGRHVDVRARRAAGGRA